jgi:predicted Zn-dependent peptidase
MKRRIMKKLYFIISLLFPWILCAQTGELSVETFQLDNGMRVVVCEDHSTPEIYGGVMVRVGSKDDPVDATGMAHYFEHIMFKGTDRIGTIDWTAEKPYLDSISKMYDKLHETSDGEKRKAIQQNINRLSIASAQYAIPNEMDQLLSKMGGKRINAYTSYDVTTYYNSFPSNQLEKWMEVYYERFRYPVFRLFQSELETVYEEKNMYADNPFERAFENLMEELFGEHPYCHPILGYTEHLKNPQISKMQQFFETYYVPNNMTLILVGDLRMEDVKQLVNNTFCKLSAKPLPDTPVIPIHPFEGRKEVSKRLTPVKAGALGYFTCTADHEDYYKVQLLSSLFNNDAKSGLIDQLNNNSDLYMAMVLSYTMKEAGILGFVYVPKIIGQSLDKAEQLITDCIDSVKKGRFSDQLFEAVKMELVAKMVRELESQSQKFNLLLSLETGQVNEQTYNKALQELSKMTKQEIVAIANKYLGNNYLAYKTRMGFPKKDKIEKPDWQPITAVNSKRESEFAQQIENREVQLITPQYIDFTRDITITPCTKNYQLYAVPNPCNDIFTLELNFYYGKNHNPNIGKAVEYFNKVGTTTKSYQLFLLELQQLGGSMEVWAGANVFIITIEGLDKNLEQIVMLCAEKFKNLQIDEKAIQNMIHDEKMNYQMIRRSPSTWAYPLFEYMIYGEKSAYLTTPGIKDMKRFTAQELIEQIKEALNTNGYFTYVGNQQANWVSHRVHTYFPLSGEPKHNGLIGRERLVFTEPQLYYIHSGKIRQSHIYFYRNGIKYENDRDRMNAACFNKYFGQDMFSIVFQEIREFRSLGYSASALYLYYQQNVANGFLYGTMGTQSDKTVEGIAAMRELMLNLPQKPEKFEAAKEALIQAQRSAYVSFRNIPEQVYTWMEEGRTEDPILGNLAVLQELTLEDITQFYGKAVDDNPLLISFVGDTRKIDKKGLLPFGNKRKVKFSEIYKP